MATAAIAEHTDSSLPQNHIFTLKYLHLDPPSASNLVYLGLSFASGGAGVPEVEGGDSGGFDDRWIDLWFCVRVCVCVARAAVAIFRADNSR